MNINDSERITGGTYNSTADIWSLGLTILAVAEGRFPLESADTHHVKGGYWGMLRMISDDEPPKPSNHFSNNFCDFISQSLQKKIEKRATASELLKASFITDWQDAVAKFDNENENESNISAYEDAFMSTKSNINNNGFSSTSPLPQRLGRKLSMLSNPNDSPVRSSNTSFAQFTDESTTQEIDIADFDEVRLRHLERIIQRLEEFVEVKNEHLNGSLGLAFEDEENSDKDPSHIIVNKQKAMRAKMNAKMIPKLEGSDFAKWESLADQLHLPVGVVRIAVKNTLEKILVREIEN